MMAVGNSEARRGPRNYVVTLYRFDSKISAIFFGTFDSFLAGLGRARQILSVWCLFLYPNGPD